MAETTLGALRKILHPWWAKVVFWVPISCSAYQFGCDQFDFPKIPKLWNMTGTMMPWWGWLLLAQAGFVYALFQYVRRIETQSGSGSVYDNTELRNKGDTSAEILTAAAPDAQGIHEDTRLRSKVADLERALNEIKDNQQRLTGQDGRISELPILRTRVSEMNEALDRHEESLKICISILGPNGLRLDDMRRQLSVLVRFMDDASFRFQAMRDLQSTHDINQELSRIETYLSELYSKTDNNNTSQMSFVIGKKPWNSALETWLSAANRYLPEEEEINIPYAMWNGGDSLEYEYRSFDLGRKIWLERKQAVDERLRQAVAMGREIHRK